MNKVVLARTSLLASALAMVLSGCGGGGGGSNTRPDAPPTTPPVSPPVSPPVTPPPTSPPPPPQPAIDAHLSLINAQTAAMNGHDGSGVRIGIVDSGVNRNHPALAGRVVANFTYVDPRVNNTAIDDVVGHGTTVAQLAAGKPFGRWPGGVAQGAQIVSARIIADKEPEDDGSGEGNEVTGALGLAPIHDDLIAAGVKIMNNSWGGLYWKDANATAPIAAEYRPFIQANGGLVVFAAGNDSQASPSDMAALPSQPGPNGTLPAADLEKGWLTVAALDTAKPTQLEWYSNACGVAMRYCLVAPGTVMFTGTNDTAGNPTYWYGSGTSFAAPLVSGAAALVWQQFPNFSNDLVRQTLLGTATDLGAPGVDAVFGYGLLNVDKALRGPGKFDWGDVEVTLPATGTQLWTNDISGTGGLTVHGSNATPAGSSAPTLTLTGNNTFTGPLHVADNATVVLNGALAADVQVDAGASIFVWDVVQHGGITNYGTTFINTTAYPRIATVIEGNVINHGMLFNSQYPNTTLTGSFEQGADGRYLVQLGDDPLHIGGTAKLDGTVFFYGMKQGYVARAHTDVLLADGRVSGQFATMAYDPTYFSLFDATMGYGPTSVWVDVARLNVITTAVQSLGGNMTPAAFSAATRVESTFQQLDASAFGNDGTTPALASGLVQGAAKIQQVGSASAFEATLKSLSGSLHTVAGSATFDAIDQNRRALVGHFDDLREHHGATGAWMRETGGLGQAGNAGAYDLRGWMLGQDVRMGDSVIGYAFGENRAYSQVAEFGDHGRDRQTQAMVYAGWSRGGLYAMGQLGAGHYQREADRRLLLGDAWFGTASRYDGQFSSVGMESGYHFDLGARARLTPYLGLQYASVQTPAFAETGGLGYGLRSEGGTTTRTFATTGLRAALAYHGWEWGAYAEWQQALSEQGTTLQASFTGVDAWAPLQSVEAGSATLLGVSAAARLSAQSRLALAYDQRLGSNPAHAWSLRYAFGF